MSVAAARVEVLTAEVRVLMVGSRQVTLSVHAQLDWVEPGEIEPFGRVAPRNAERGEVHVVGASVRLIDKGTLVRSSSETSASLLETANNTRQLAAAMVAKAQWLAALNQQTIARNQGDQPPASGRVRELQDWFDTLCHDAGLTDDPYYGHPDLVHPRRDRVEALRKSAETLEAEAGDAALWEALPLIVLAGLR